MPPMKLTSGELFKLVLILGLSSIRRKKGMLSGFVVETAHENEIV